MKIEIEVPEIGEKVSYWVNNFSHTTPATIVEYEQKNYKLKVLLQLEDKSRIWKNITDLVYNSK